MALKQRNIVSDYQPQEGKVALDDKSQSHETFLARRAQESYTNDPHLAIYAPNLDPNYEKHKNRKISYSYALSNLYHSLNKLDNAFRLDPNDEDYDRKKDEKELVESMIKIVDNIFPEIMEKEYPGVTYTKTKERINVKIPGNPQHFEFNEKQKVQMGKIANFQALADYMLENDPNFQHKSVTYLKEFSQTVQRKLSGNEVFAKEKTKEDISNDIKSRIQMLIRDDNDSEKKVDRQRAEEALAKSLSPLGMELSAVILKEKSPEEELISQAKTCVLRACWDGFIERPQQGMCSSALKSVLYTGAKKDPKEYNLDESPVWKICAQMPAFTKDNLKFKLMEALGAQGFPPERIKELSYSDIAFVLNLKMQQNSSDVRKLQKQKKNTVDGIKIDSGREHYFKKYIQEHEKDIRALLTLQGIPETQIKDTLEKMHQGKNDFFDGHHNYPISDPDTFEKITGKNWTQMNGFDNIKLMDKEAHALLHSIENNVNRNGKIIENGTSSNRTIFENKKTGQKFYYIIRVKDCLDGVAGLNQEFIFNKPYLQNNDFGNGHISTLKETEQKNLESSQAFQNKGSDKNKKQAQHVQNRLNNLNERNLQNHSGTSLKDKIKSKENSTQRPNHQGRGNHGAYANKRNGFNDQR